MDREKILSSEIKKSRVVSVSVEGIDTIYMTLLDEDENEIELILDVVAANGFKMAIGSLQNIPPLSLPKNPTGEYQCHYERITFTESGEVAFEKENGITEPFGLYTFIEDGMIVFNEVEELWLCFSCEDATICTFEEDYVAIIIPIHVLEVLKREILDYIFPFNRFGKDNKMSYGYFHTIEEE